MADVKTRVDQVISLRCGVSFGYPHPQLSISIGNYSLQLQCKTQSNKYGGQAVTCTSQVAARADMNNATITCESEQSGSFYQVSQARVTVTAASEEPKSRTAVWIYVGSALAAVVVIALLLWLAIFLGVSIGF